MYFTISKRFFPTFGYLGIVIIAQWIVSESLFNAEDSFLRSIAIFTNDKHRESFHGTIFYGKIFFGYFSPAVPIHSSRLIEIPLQYSIHGIAYPLHRVGHLRSPWTSRVSRFTDGFRLFHVGPIKYSAYRCTSCLKNGKGHGDGLGFKVGSGDRGCV